MAQDPATALYAMAAVVGGLVGFATLALAGVRIVRWLKLPQELPEGPRYEPAPPPLRPRPDRAAAVATAATQEQLRQNHHVAWRALKAAQACQDLEAVVAGAVATPERSAALVAEVAAAVAKAAATASAAAAGAEQGMRMADPISAGLHTSAQGAIAELALIEAQAAVATLGLKADNRRLWWLLLVALIAAAWLVALLPSLRGGR